MLASSLLLLALASNALSISLPPVTGTNKVGTVAIELIDNSRTDPFAPNVRSRNLMVSVFYPVQHVRRYSLAPDFTPLYSQYADSAYGLVPGTGASIITQAYAGAYLHPPSGAKAQPDILFFSPGYGNARTEYSAALSNLASLGYLVIGIDHPFDTSFIAYPDGRTAFRTDDRLDTPEHIIQAVDVRVADVRFVLDALSKNATLARQIPGVHGKLDGKKVGIFGHSLGGSTSAATMLVDSRFACGSNLDGRLVGPVIDAGLTRPFLTMGAEGHNRTTEDTWETFYGKSTGWKLELAVKGAAHTSYSDILVLYQKLRDLDLIADVGGVFGTIDGVRMLDIESAYLSAFFDKCFSGKREQLLERPSAKFPEVVFV